MIRLVRGALRRSLTFLLLDAVGTSYAADPATRAAGATPPLPVYAKWASEYKRATGVEVALQRPHRLYPGAAL